MIHQCFFREDQRAALFPQAPYRGFGLEPDVNAALTERCPELADYTTRLALVEYAAMLCHWRSPDVDTDAWIGFTSYRQLAKSPFVFETRAAVEAALNEADVVSWGVWNVSRAQIGWLRGAPAQAEISSPGLHKFTTDVLGHFKVKIPNAYYIGEQVVFANYWVMSRSAFERFMLWSWPIINHALKLDHEYKHSRPISAAIDQRKAVGYFSERLYAIWVMQQRLTVKPMGPVSNA